MRNLLMIAACVAGGLACRPGPGYRVLRLDTASDAIPVIVMGRWVGTDDFHVVDPATLMLVVWSDGAMVRRLGDWLGPAVATGAPGAYEQGRLTKEDFDALIALARAAFTYPEPCFEGVAPDGPVVSLRLRCTDGTALRTEAMDKEGEYLRRVWEFATARPLLYRSTLAAPPRQTSFVEDRDWLRIKPSISAETAP